MKMLENLKKDILNNKIESFYVFYGEDYGIRKHYIDKLKTYFDRVTVVDSCEDISNSIVAKSLFKLKELYIVYNDEEFAKLSKMKIQTFINRLKDKTLILIYEEPLDSSVLFKEFSSYITYFPVVQDNIALEFVDSEMKLMEESKKDIIFDCKNNYNNILMEADKVKNYAEAKSLSEQNSYESLRLKQQTLDEMEPFRSDIMMNDILSGNFNNIGYWLNICKKKDLERFFISLTSIFNDFLIAYYILEYGYYKGSSLAYEIGLPWGRIKRIRDLHIPVSKEYLIDCAYKVAELDKFMKLGKINKDELVDYFVSLIV